MVEALAHLERHGEGRACVTTRALADAFRRRVRGRPESLKGGNKRKRKRKQDTDAQRRYSGRHYHNQLHATYQENKQRFREQGKDTPETLRKLKQGIIEKETTPYTGFIKKQVLKVFDKWVEDDIASTTTMRNNSR